MQIKVMEVMEDILGCNDQLAAEIAARLTAAGVFVINLLGSPGCGKTSLLESTIAALRQEFAIAVIEGDLFTAKDAERIERQGVPVIQINTAGGCHLDANMIQGVLTELDITKLDLIVIENVGNLVCPASFALGEDAKVTVLSVTEGEDKPLKYPLVFQESSMAIINKIDLLPYTSFDMEAAVRDITSIHPGIALVSASCRTGEGLQAWYDWLRTQVRNKQARRMG